MRYELFDKKRKSKKRYENRHKKVVGILSKHKRGFGFVIPEKEQGGDIFVSSSKINGAMNGDRVEVWVLSRYAGEGTRQEGEIRKILERASTEVVGTFAKSKKFAFVVPDDRRQCDDVFVSKSNFKGAKEGDKVVAKITKYPDKTNSAEGTISEIISRNGEPGGDIKALIRSYNLFQSFPSRANAEAKTVAKNEPGEADIKNRVDLRSKTVFTIDGADSKDFDDAVSVEKLKNGNFLLGVHIADVSHYVAEGGPLDKEALKRGNSVYLIDQVVPMLPKVLSNGICSLNPHVDRLTLSVDMEISRDGETVNHRIYESIIHSAERLIYSDISDILENKDQELIKRYEAIYDDLLMMKELAEILRRRREARGSLDFDLDEAYITLDEGGIPVRVDVAERRTANRLIEEFMLEANETVAEHFFRLEAPFVYRVHEKPALDKMAEFATFLRGLGIVLKGNPEEIHPKALNEVLEQVKGTAYEKVVNTVMLRSMKKAFYDIQCGGHFGLSLKYYCHFTSPIRRYPDLIIHRIIKESLRELPQGSRQKTLRKKVKEAAEISSATEKQAMELEREVEKMKKAEYMSYHIGEAFDGIISGVTNFGFYVELENTIEGMVRIDYLDEDDFDFDPKKYRLTGRYTSSVYALGDKVTIKVISASAETREIDFMLASGTNQCGRRR